MLQAENRTPFLARSPVLSVVVPVHNEQDNVLPLAAELRAALDGVIDYEVVFVDDGSTDATRVRLAEAAHADERVRVICHQRSYGQSTALHTGVRHARGAWVATMDGDGQNDPADIPRFIAEWEARQQTMPRLALVAGHRVKRRDSAVVRLSSRIANGVRSRMLRDGTPDTGCGLKLFARETFLLLPYFDHMHRFLPALVRRAGGDVVSGPVNHRPRASGRSHYGVHNRLWTGIVDLIGVMWLARRARVPMISELTVEARAGQGVAAPGRRAVVAAADGTGGRDR
jgi:dolichol-phosphate mannosyltransferase